jgi:monovalent cation/hydrogen antiporter
MLPLGLWLMTTCLVAVVAQRAIGLPWAATFALGAIVSPTDAIAATAIAQRLGVLRRKVTILEGESLINDATGSSPTG